MQLSVTRSVCSLRDIERSGEHVVVQVIPITTDRLEKRLASGGRYLVLEILQVVLCVDARQNLFHMHRR